MLFAFNHQRIRRFCAITKHMHTSVKTGKMIPLYVDVFTGLL